VLFGKDVSVQGSVLVLFQRLDCFVASALESPESVVCEANVLEEQICLMVERAKIVSPGVKDCQNNMASVVSVEIVGDSWCFFPSHGNPLPESHAVIPANPHVQVLDNVTKEVEEDYNVPGLVWVCKL
jgi:hypothetical protein